MVERTAIDEAGSDSWACDLPVVVSMLLKNSRPVHFATDSLNGLDPSLRSGKVDEDDDGGRELFSLTAVDVSSETIGQVGADYRISERVHNIFVSRRRST